MKKNIVTVLTLEEMLNEKAMQATVSTLKRIYSSSCDSKVLDMLNGLYVDQKSMGNRALSSYTVSDGYDCFIVAYSYLWEQIVSNGMCFDDTITVTLKGGKEKERTVFQWACVKVREHIYKHGQVNYKRVYVDNYKQVDVWGEEESDGQVFDRLYLQVGKYYDMSSFEDVDNYNYMYGVISERMTDRQKTVTHYRMQGFSISDIADKLNVSHQAVSKTLKQVQNIVKELFPESVNGFKEKRIVNR